MQQAKTAAAHKKKLPLPAAADDFCTKLVLIKDENEIIVRRRENLLIFHPKCQQLGKHIAVISAKLVAVSNI